MGSIPFNRPFIVGKELHYISQAVLGGHLAGDGIFTRRCQEWLEQRTGAAQVLLTPSCTAALELAAILIDIVEGDEVILPSYTFVSTANAFVLRGAKPVFVDIRADSLNIDETIIEEAITERTRAVVPVHYAGIACEMDAILATAKRHGLRVIEDAAQGVDATYKERYLGTIGDLGSYSFHETKNYICGEGGALVVNDPKLQQRAEIVREKGTNRGQFFRGEIERYTWVDIGSSYLPSEIVAAFLYAQLEAADTINSKRNAAYQHYAARLEPLAARGLLRLPVVPPGCQHTAHMFYLLLQPGEDRAEFLGYLHDRGIEAVFHYVPLHLSPMGRRFGYRPGLLPQTEELSARVVRLPCFYEISVEEQEQLIVAIYDYFKLVPPQG